MLLYIVWTCCKQHVSTSKAWGEWYLDKMFAPWMSLEGNSLTCAHQNDSLAPKFMYTYLHVQKQGHAARNDPAQFHLFSSSSVFSFATLPGFCDIRILTWLAFPLVFAWLCSRFHEFTVVEAFNFCPHTKKNEVFIFFTCKSLPTCQVLSILQVFQSPHHQQRNNMWRSNDPRDLYSVATWNVRSARNVNIPPHPTPHHPTPSAT